ncbi:MAG: GNAT family N-acetyltransferase [Spirochaetaceae bacterium]|jgi:ribosomal protein S18 acetylase RimI-like enzyme|nr:GNAT family N-acetyltransferase [Spirochaetaceae bacterium]
MYKIRPMKIEDFKEIIHLWENTEGIGLWGKDDSRKSIKMFLEKNQNTCFVAEINDEIMGTIMGGNDGRRGHIYHLAVKPEYRKKGIGKKLLEKTERGFKKEGIRKIFLVAFKENKQGNKFWENNGYKTRKDLHYRDKETTER